MADNRVILITGVSGFFGSCVALRLMELPGVRVIGLDRKPPKGEKLAGLDFIQADVRNSLLPELFKSEHIDAVLHLAFVESERPSEDAFAINVQGATRVLAACAEAGVSKVVLKSSTMVYGARADNSAFLAEERSLHGNPRSGTVRDLVEVESFCSGFARQTPEVRLTVLRFASIVGPSVDSPMTRFLREVWSPTLLGFDPMMQVIHEEDVVGALVHAALHDAPGVYNVAAEGILPLAQLMAIAGKPPLPLLHVVAYLGHDLLKSPDVARFLPIEPDYLRYPWVADIAKMREEFGWAPRYTAMETLREFAGLQRLRRFLPARSALAYDEERLRDTIERRRRSREAAESESISHDA